MSIRLLSIMSIGIYVYLSIYIFNMNLDNIRHTMNRWPRDIFLTLSGSPRSLLQRDDSVESLLDSSDTPGSAAWWLFKNNWPSEWQCMYNNCYAFVFAGSAWITIITGCYLQVLVSIIIQIMATINTNELNIYLLCPSRMEIGFWAVAAGVASVSESSDSASENISDFD